MSVLSAATRLSRGSGHGSALVNSVDGFVFDCDGVIWRGSELIPGADRVLNSLAAAGKKVIFVTNASTKTLEQFQAKFEQFGVPVATSQLVSSASTMTAYMVEHGFAGKKVYVIGEPALHDSLRGAGVETIGDRDGSKTFADTRELSSENLEKDIGAVVCGWDSGFNYFKMAKAGSLIRYRDCPLICTNKDLASPLLPGGHLLPGAGAMVTAVESCSGKQATNLGKPSKDLIDHLIRRFDLDPGRMCMVGDRLDTDILFGKNGGLKTLLVGTGATPSDVTQKLVEGVAHNELPIPDFVADSIATLLE